jgi:CysZ protein
MLQIRPYSLPNLSNGRLGAFLSGLTLPFRGAGFLLGRPALWPLVLIPLVLNIILFSLALYYGGAYFSDALTKWIGGWGDVRWYWKIALALIQVFFWAIVLLLVYFVFMPVAVMIAAPFDDVIAEQAEQACGFGFQDSLSFWRSLVATAWYCVLSQGKNLAVVLLVLLLILPLNLIPVAGSILYTILSGCWFVASSAFQFVSFPCERRRMRYREKWRLLRANGAFALGFGCMTAALLLVPFVNVLVIPLCAVGGTFFYGMVRAKA